ncbi:hypothetical protein H109_03230 [Trichophyton interdigitale MR816]|uniref:GPI ethanolamine phosphate transferase 1 C-terminal domain-containing protein n=1 Tax=Trichophyton interdigitale (strain MR816) TaxID=1215338 RepID=A0A059JAW1_TRIIM|nr:hypothetical protein H109_03230 [Trichophyton interdigitale MR816]
MPTASLVLPFTHVLRPRKHYLHGHMTIFLALGPLFIIFTIFYEGLFYFAIATTLFSWVQLEHRIQQRYKVDNTKKAPKEKMSAPPATTTETAKHREKFSAEGN